MINNVDFVVIKNSVKGRCLVSKSAISVGDTILREQPFACCPKENSPSFEISVITGPYSLNSIEQSLLEATKSNGFNAYASILAARCLIAHLCTNDEQQKALWKELAAKNYLADDPMYENLSACSAIVFRLLAHQGYGQMIKIDDCISALKKIEVNSFSIVNFEFNECGTGLYLFASTINHNCNPNAQQIFDSSTGEIVIRAIRAIDPGEEICISYIDLGKPKIFRGIELGKYGFNCCCNRCLSFGTESYFEGISCQRKGCKGIVHFSPEIDSEKRFYHAWIDHHKLSLSSTNNLNISAFDEFGNYPIPLASELVESHNRNPQTTIVCSTCLASLPRDLVHDKLRNLTKKLRQIDCQLDRKSNLHFSEALRWISLTNELDVLAKELLPPSHFMSHFIYSKTSGLLLTLYEQQLYSWDSSPNSKAPVPSFHSLSMDLVRHQLLFVNHTLLCYQLASGQVKPLHAIVVSRKIILMVTIATVLEDFLNHLKGSTNLSQQTRNSSFHDEMRTFLIDNIQSVKVFDYSTLMYEAEICYVDNRTSKYNIKSVLMNAFGVINYFISM